MTASAHPPLIALLTDMGSEDWYVGAMKAVAHSICPEVRFIDICHEVAKQSAREAAFMLKINHRYFAPGTVFLCVVDPEVGWERKALAARAGDCFFVAPDNGLLRPVLGEFETWEARELNNPDWRLPQASATFHGRDVFAPGAARLAAGEDFAQAGPVLETLEELKAFGEVRRFDSGLSGQVVYIDTYGNLLTNVTRDEMPESVAPGAMQLRFKGRTIKGLSPNYASVPTKHPLIYWGSSGVLEIAVSHASAARKWNAQVGEWFDLSWG